MARKAYKVLGVLLLFFASWIEAERVMRPKMKDIKIWSDNTYVTHSIAFDGNDPHLNLSMVALKELHDVDIHFDGTVVHKSDPNYYFSFNTTMNACRLLNWRNQSPFGNLIHAYLKEYGKMIESCPIAKGEYYMHKFWIPEDSTSASFPEVDFELHFMAHHIDSNKERTVIANDHIFGEAVVQDVQIARRGLLSMLPKHG